MICYNIIKGGSFMSNVLLDVFNLRKSFGTEHYKEHLDNFSKSYKVS